jgi:regulation of enolase protein 1 (concanavalin A-like superfamily)
MPSVHFQSLNIPEEDVPKDISSFTLDARPQTNLWRRPPGTDTSTAPLLFRRLRFPFVSAEVTVYADWVMEWDQAGLVLFVGEPCSNNPSVPSTEFPPIPVGNNPSARPPMTSEDVLPPYPTPNSSKWVKFGLEYSNNICFASVTRSTDHGCDWSLAALPHYQSERDDLRVKFERIGIALWLYYYDQLKGWQRLREISDFFYGVDNKNIRAGVYASRPANFDSPFNTQVNERMSRDLRVVFDDLRIY